MDFTAISMTLTALQFFEQTEGESISCLFKKLKRGCPSATPFEFLMI